MSNKFIGLSYRAVLSIFVTAGPALAAPEIVVTGQGIGPQPGHQAYDVVVIDRDRISESASARLEDILRDTAGFQQFRRSDSRSAHPTSQGASLRGLGGNASARALVLLDGLPLADPFGGWINWSALDPSRFRQIQVVRGGGSVSGGPGALAGTIMLESLSAADSSVAEASLLYGSRDSIDGQAIFAGDLGDGHALLSGRYLEGNGFIPVIAADRGPADRPAGFRQGNVAARAAFPISDDYELQGSAIIFSDRRDRGTAATRNQSKGADMGLRLVGRGDWQLEAAAWLQLRDFSSQFASVNADRTEANLVVDQYSVPATGLGGRIEVSPPLGEQVELRMGADFRQHEGASNELYSFTDGLPTRRRSAGGETRTAGVFADVAYDATDTLMLTAGGRIDRWWIRDGRLTETMLGSGAPITQDRPPNRSDWESTARAALQWRAADALTFRSAAYVGWRMPTLNELYRPFRVGADATAANPFLKPERLRGVDLGVEYNPLPALRLNATLFWDQLDDAIANVTLARGPGNFPGVGFVGAAGEYRQRQNVDAVRSRGVELDGALRYGPWTFGASYAYVDARVRADGAAAFMQGKRPAQTPKHLLSGNVAWRDEGRMLAATVRYVGPQYEDDQNQRRLDGAVTFDLAAELPLGSGFTLLARGENLTNTLVEAGISGNGVIERATPRTVWAGLRYSLR